MSDVATLLAQLSGRAEPAADPAMAAVRLARASLDALVLKLGQSIAATVIADLPGGLTQFAAGSDSFVLKLATPLPAGTAVKLTIASAPSGQPQVTVTPLPLQAATRAIPLAQSTPPAPATMPPTTASSPRTVVAPVSQAASAPVALPPAARPSVPASPSPPAAAPLEPAPTVGTVPRPTALPPSTPTPAVAPPVPATTAPPPAALTVPTVPPHAPVAVPSGAQPSAIGATPIPSTPVQLTTSPAALSPLAGGPQLVQSQPQPAVPSVSTAATSLTALSPFPATMTPPQVLLQSPPSNAPSSIPTPAQSPPPPAQSVLSPATTHPVASASPSADGPQVRPAPSQPVQRPAAIGPVPQSTTAARPPVVATAPPLSQVVADPVQAAARQDSLAPLLVKAAAVMATPAAVSALPRPILEAVARVLASRLDLNRAPPDGKALKDAVLKAGVIAGPATRPPTDARTALLALRSAALALLGGEVEPVAPVGARPSPPLKGEPSRAPEPRTLMPLPAEEPVETVRQLLGHTDSALSRLKLLQHASNPQEARSGNMGTPAGTEFRVEVPLQLGAETGILQLLVERDGRRKATPRERGWRMSFALNFTATGEVGAEIALFGRAANIALWAVEPATADALDAMLPELSPALARHGLDVTGLRVRRGAPRRTSSSPGQLLDSAR